MDRVVCCGIGGLIPVDSGKKNLALAGHIDYF
jgi:hypothetical protein